VRNKSPTKPKNALIKQKKQVRFTNSDIKEVVVETLVKASSRGRAIKPRVIFKQGEN
jgi:hypothetical protein